MTLDEAIERLKTDIYKYADFTENPNENEFWMAFDMAIKALEQQSEDAISRAETVQFLINHSNDFEDAKIRMAFQAASSLVNNPHNLPTVSPKYNTSEWCHDCSEYNQDKHCCPRYNKVIRNTVEEIKEPKIGHWIRVTDKAGHLVWECDKCGWQQRFNTNFCPDCGRVMIEPQKSEDKE